MTRIVSIEAIPGLLVRNSWMTFSVLIGNGDASLLLCFISAPTRYKQRNVVDRSGNTRGFRTAKATMSGHVHPSFPTLADVEYDKETPVNVTERLLVAITPVC